LRIVCDNDRDRLDRRWFGKHYDGFIVNRSFYDRLLPDR
jgi:hypothetical protein